MQNIFKKSFVFLLFVAAQFSIPQEAPKWAVDLGEPIKTYDFMQEGKFLFFTSG